MSKKLKEALAQPAQAPVAWMYDWLCDGKLITGWIAHSESEIPKSMAFNIRPLYTVPPQPAQEPVAGTKTWFEDGKVVTQYLTAKDIYKEPAQEPAIGDIRALKHRIHELEGEVIGYKRILDAQPALEPKSVTYNEVADSMNALRKGNSAQKACAEEVGKLKLYTAPPQPTVQVSPLEFVEMVMEKEHLVGNPIVWAQWPNKEKNNGT